MANTVTDEAPASFKIRAHSEAVCPVVKISSISKRFFDLISSGRLAKNAPFTFIFLSFFVKSDWAVSDLVRTKFPEE